MSKHVGNNKKGFTIIEVVLVLAIAGLIFLIVFLAVPALQRSRRDTQRKNDVGRFIAQLEQYAGNNNGEYPAGSDVAIREFADDYMDDFKDPSADSYNLQGDQSVKPTNNGDFFYYKGAKCGSGGTSREIAVAVALENGGSYCQDNS